jgi:hypothetical protein
MSCSVLSSHHSTASSSTALGREPVGKAVVAVPAPACTPLSKHPRRLVPALAAADTNSSRQQDDKEVKLLQQVAQGAMISPGRDG